MTCRARGHGQRCVEITAETYGLWQYKALSGQWGGGYSRKIRYPIRLVRHCYGALANIGVQDTVAKRPQSGRTRIKLSMEEREKDTSRSGSCSQINHACTMGYMVIPKR